MYWAMYAGSWQPGPMRFSESRASMAITMGCTMGFAMLAWVAAGWGSNGDQR